MVISPFINRVPWMVLTIFSFLLFYICVFYWTFRSDVNFLLVKGQLVYDPVWRTVFYFHVLAGMLVIVAGPFQFLGFFRRKFAKLHKVTGKIYVGAILAIGAPTGLYMAFFAEGGFWAGLGFSFMSLTWFYTTFKAFSLIRKRKVQEHVQWMVRSYAVSFSAVTLRILVPVLSLLLGMEHHFVIILTAWISWLLNLLVAELLIRTKSKLLTQ